MRPGPACSLMLTMAGLNTSGVITKNAPCPQPTCPSCWPSRCRSAASTGCQAPPLKRSSAPPLPRRTQGGRSSSGSSAIAVSLVQTCLRDRAELFEVN